MLLPSTKLENFIYENVAAKDLAGKFDIDIGFTDTYECSNVNCTEKKEYSGPSLVVFPKTTGTTTTSLTRTRSMHQIASPPPSGRTLCHFERPFSGLGLHLVPFVPVGIRLHASHSTLAYFTGLEGTHRNGFVRTTPFYS
jgi:hypothetical protein